MRRYIKHEPIMLTITRVHMEYKAYGKKKSAQGD